MADDLNSTDPRPSDAQNNLLAKILRRLRNIAEVFSGPVTVELTPGDIEVGAIEIKDSDTDARAKVLGAAPVGTEQGLVTRNIPSGNQNVVITDGLDPAFITPEGALYVASLPISYNVSATEELGNAEARLFHVIGRREAFNSTTILQDIGEWLGGTFNAFPVPLTGAEALQILSSSAADTNTAGAGARKVKITYINALGALTVSAAINLNGVTPVATGITALTVLWMEVVDVGTVGGVAAGNIDIRTTVGAVIYDRISAGGNRSLTCHFMVPAGYTGYVFQWDASAVGGATQDVRLRATAEGVSRALTTTWLFQDNTFLTAGSHSEVDLPFFRIPELGRVKVSTISSATGAGNRIDSGFTVIIVKN